MKKITCILLFFISISVYSQESKDTSFSIRGFNCVCKYHINQLDDNKIFERSVTPAYFPGSEEEWKKFLKKNLNLKLKGNNVVQFRFEIDKNGDPNNFLLMNEAPVEKFNEIIRVIRLSGKWFPAIQGGFCVKSYVRMKLEL